MESDRSNNVSSVIQGYESVGQEYRLKSAQKYLVEGLIAGKLMIIDENKMNTRKKQKIDISFRNLAASVREMELLRQEYHDEIKRSQLIKEDCERFKSMVIHDKENTQESNKDIKSTKEFLDVELLDERLNYLEQEQQKSSALLQGLMKLIGLKAIDVQALPDDSLEVKMEILLIEVKIIMNREMKVMDIKLTKNENSIDISESILQKIVKDCSILSAPQDLRYAVFAVSSIQTSKKILADHISELRKKCLVTILDTMMSGDSKEYSPYSVQLTLSSGVTTVINIHECYPEIPGGVKISSLYGVGGWNNNDLEVIKNTINHEGYRNLSDLFDHLHTLSST